MYALVYPDKGPCDFRSRRLHEARREVNSCITDLGEYAYWLTLEQCGGHVTVFAEVKQFCSACIAEIRLRFQYLYTVPFLFANVCDKGVAVEIVAACRDC